MGLTLIKGRPTEEGFRAQASKAKLNPAIESLPRPKFGVVREEFPGC